MNINQIDNEINRQLELLKHEIESVQFDEICEFRLQDAEKLIPWDNLNHKGIYLFEIKNDNRFFDFDCWISDFKQIWELDEYKYKFTPNTKKVRIKAHNQLMDWIPLYIGKSRIIGRRVHEHIYKDLNKTTFALKLLARKNLRNHSFRLKVLRVDVKNYDTIVPKIEWQLRNRINPIIGRQ